MVAKDNIASKQATTSAVELERVLKATRSTIESRLNLSPVVANSESSTNLLNTNKHRSINCENLKPKASLYSPINSANHKRLVVSNSSDKIAINSLLVNNSNVPIRTRYTQIGARTKTAGTSKSSSFVNNFNTDTIPLPKTKLLTRKSYSSSLLLPKTADGSIDKNVSKKLNPNIKADKQMQIRPLLHQITKPLGRIGLMGIKFPENILNAPKVQSEKRS